VTATAPEVATVDREGNLARLREKIARDASSVTPDPDTFVGSEDVTDAEAEAAALLDATESSAASGAQLCLYPDDVVPKLASWPLTGVAVAMHGAYREVFTTETVTVDAPLSPSASSSLPQSETITTVHLRLPVAPLKTAVASCVPSAVVGVTTGGYMLFNNDASVWKQTGADTLIGYARDGFPIYGVYTGSVDACGGYDHPAGYRYTISPDRPYMIGCFTATPQSFNF
jgi:hypothetical protein